MKVNAYIYHKLVSRIRLGRLFFADLGYFQAGTLLELPPRLEEQRFGGIGIFLPGPVVGVRFDVWMIRQRRSERQHGEQQITAAESDALLKTLGSQRNGDYVVWANGSTHCGTRPSPRSFRNEGR